MKANKNKEQEWEKVFLKKSKETKKYEIYPMYCKSCGKKIMDNFIFQNCETVCDECKNKKD